ncbi:MAG: hypothetical protein M1834_009751 [Cirrosporium novae-zelandiae]|nr:MAG: hypothetical protein M1834_009751 [Cirrosporium novae-zelandiae]
MATVSILYNTLPCLGDAEKQFVDRENVFAAVGNLLAQYGNAFGLCLIHAHCTLAEDELMLAKEDISQPEKASSLKDYYPERWLPTGEVYEFTTRPTTAPPAELSNEFKRLTSHIGVLGLYHIDDKSESKKIEYTEGRKNILRPFLEANRTQTINHIETAWNLGKGDPVTMACVIVCDSRTTRGGAVHKKGVVAALITAGR